MDVKQLEIEGSCNKKLIEYMLETLKLCEGNIESLLASAHPRVFGVWLDVVRAAIAKAEREATCKYGNIPAECTTTPMDCQCAIDAALAP